VAMSDKSGSLSSESCELIRLSMPDHSNNSQLNTTTIRLEHSLTINKSALSFSQVEFIWFKIRICPHTVCTVHSFRSNFRGLS
jgi:hypothetical protein